MSLLLWLELGADCPALGSVYIQSAASQVSGRNVEQFLQSTLRARDQVDVVGVSHTIDGPGPQLEADMFRQVSAHPSVFTNAL